MRSRKPYGSWEELHDSLVYGRKSISNRSYLECRTCAKGNLDGHELKHHTINLHPSGVIAVNSVGYHLATPRANHRAAVENIWVVNLVLENIGLRWAPIGTGPNREKIGVASKNIQYPSARFDRAAVVGTHRVGGCQILWDGRVRGFDGRKWALPEPPKKSYPRIADAAKRANYHARMLGFPSTSRLWGYKMAPGLTEEICKELDKMARDSGYTNVARAWENGHYITHDPVFGAKLPFMIYKYNETLESGKSTGPTMNETLCLRKQQKTNKFYETHIKRRTI